MNRLSLRDHLEAASVPAAILGGLAVVVWLAVETRDDPRAYDVGSLGEWLAWVVWDLWSQVMGRV